MCGGTPITYMVPSCPKGSIPACAGEPLALLAGQVFVRVYPRVCGGTGSAWSWIGNRKGLSPRVRGNPYFANRGVPPIGSIPACAGEPAVGMLGRTGEQVYPRVCGGTRMATHHQPVAGGLSPRVRGNPGQLGDRRQRRRSIPACAGEPLVQRTGDQRLRVYPRVCGGTTIGLKS